MFEGVNWPPSDFEARLQSSLPDDIPSPRESVPRKGNTEGEAASTAADLRSTEEMDSRVVVAESLGSSLAEVSCSLPSDGAAEASLQVILDRASVSSRPSDETGTAPSSNFESSKPIPGSYFF